MNAAPWNAITEAQRQFYTENYHTSRLPTRFDEQNNALKIGGAPLPIHRKVLPARRLPPPDTYVSIPYQPRADVADIYGNPLVFDYGSAVRSELPPPVTVPSEFLDRMMRDVSEVDPRLVTNPLPDPTFMARMPQFDTSVEDAGTLRLRLERATGPMRFF